MILRSTQLCTKLRRSALLCPALLCSTRHASAPPRAPTRAHQVRQAHSWGLFFVCAFARAETRALICMPMSWTGARNTRAPFKYKLARRLQVPNLSQTRAGEPNWAPNWSRLVIQSAPIVKQSIKQSAIRSLARSSARSLDQLLPLAGAPTQPRPPYRPPRAPTGQVQRPRARSLCARLPGNKVRLLAAR